MPLKFQSLYQISFLVSQSTFKTINRGLDQQSVKVLLISYTDKIGYKFFFSWKTKDFSTLWKRNWLNWLGNHLFQPFWQWTVTSPSHCHKSVFSGSMWCGGFNGSFKNYKGYAILYYIITQAILYYIITQVPVQQYPGLQCWPQNLPCSVDLRPSFPNNCVSLLSGLLFQGFIAVMMVVTSLMQTDLYSLSKVTVATPLCQS